MQFEYLGAIVQTVQNIGQGIVALLPIIVVPVGMYKVVQWSFSARAGLGKLTGNLTDRSKGLVNKARDRAQQSNMYQRPQMAKEFRKQERRRANVADYAERITAEGWRGDRLRRRAAGRGNAAGQQRAYVSGLSQQEKQEHEEASQASLVLESNGVNRPMDLAAIAGGRAAAGINGTVSGTGNRAMQQAAIQKIIKAQDAQAIESMFMDDSVDKQMLVNELTKEQNYGTSKGAGAHFVQMAPQTYTRPQINRQAMMSMSALKTDALASQDGPAWDSAITGFNTANASTDAAERTATLTARQNLWDLVKKIEADPRAEAQLKGSARAAYDSIRATTRPTT